MYVVKVHEDHPGTVKPFSVTVDGWWLTRKCGGRRRFGDSMSAAIAGAKHIDHLKRLAHNGRAEHE